MRKPIFVLNGPNLNLLGVREPHIYGAATLLDVERGCRDRAAAHGFEVTFRQSNHEGVLIDWLQDAREAAAGVVINPGAYTHTSIALHDAAKALAIPLVEAHVSNPSAREPFRHVSMIAPVATGTIAGLGTLSYLLAIDAVCALARAAEAGQGEDAA